MFKKIKKTNKSLKIKIISRIVILPCYTFRYHRRNFCLKFQAGIHKRSENPLKNHSQGRERQPYVFDGYGRYTKQENIYSKA
jgi:hypothetical protein